MCNNPAEPTRPGGQLPAGVYWIGDLSYVIEGYYEKSFYKLEGVNRAEEGFSFALYGTEGGDGVFEDTDGDEYSSDSANIGCIPIDAIEEPPPLGHIVRFHAPFICRWLDEGGFVCFGDLAIKTDSLSDAEYPEACAQEQEPCAKATYTKLDPYELVDLILRDADEADSDTQLVMNEIAYSIMECSSLLGYGAWGDRDRQSLIHDFHLVFHSGRAEFTEYFRGFYGTPDNETHAMHLEEGRTRRELYAFLERLNWDSIFELCRRHADVDSVARIFQAWTGLGYAAERARYPMEEWDGTPRWPMEDGKYLPSD